MDVKSADSLVFTKAEGLAECLLDLAQYFHSGHIFPIPEQDQEVIGFVGNGPRVQSLCGFDFSYSEIEILRSRM